MDFLRDTDIATYLPFHSNQSIFVSAIMKLACNLFLAASLTVLPCVLGSEGPCDIFDSDGSPCVAAHSLVRALYGKYDGPLYQVKRSSDNATIDVATLEPGGFANARSQDDFCEGQSCIITRIYDQSDMKNDLDTAPAGGAVNTPDEGVDAARFKLSVGGNEVYGAYFDNGQGYRRDDTKGIAVDDEPESMYMVVDGKFYNSGCCFDYGNAETDNLDDKAGTMESMYWGNNADSGRGTGSGPWIMADLEVRFFPLYFAPLPTHCCSHIRPSILLSFSRAGRSLAWKREL